MREISHIPQVWFFVPHFAHIFFIIRGRNLQWSVRNRCGKIEKKWFVFILVYKIQRGYEHMLRSIDWLYELFVRIEVQWIASLGQTRFGCDDFVIQPDFLVILPQVRRI